MVLAAGIGKRMRPLTATTPKPLVEVAGQALIDHVFDRLERVGVREAVVNVHYLADLLEVHVRRRKSDVLAHISDERDRLLDTGGGVKKALPLLGEGPFFLCNADSFWVEGVRPNLAILAGAWRSGTMDALLLLAPTVSAVGYDGAGDFTLGPDGRLARRLEKHIAPFAYAGAAILSPALFGDTPEGPFSLNLLFDRAIESGRLFGVRMDGLWLHVGTPAAVRAAEMAISRSAA